MKVTVLNNEIKTYLDNTVIFSVTDTSFGSGGIGLYQSANQNGHFDNVLYESLQPVPELSTFGMLFLIFGCFSIKKLIKKIC